MNGLSNESGKCAPQIRSDAVSFLENENCGFEKGVSSGDACRDAGTRLLISENCINATHQSDNGASNSIGPNEDINWPAKIRSKFLDEYSKAKEWIRRAAKSKELMVRKPIRRFRGPKSAQMGLTIIDSLIREQLLKSSQVNYNQLNALAYSAGITAAWYVRTRWPKPGVKDGKWFRENRLLRNRLSREISKIDILGKRGTQFYGFTYRDQMWIKKLAANHGGDGRNCQTLAALRARLVKLQAEAEAAYERAARAQRKDRTLKEQVLGSNSEAGLESADLIREHWDKIVGKTIDNPTCDELEAWKHHLKSHIKDKAKFRVSNETWSLVVRKSKSWVASGPDGIPNAIWKLFPAASGELQKWVSRILKGRTTAPKWSRKVRSVQLLKNTDGDIQDVNNYRSIACMNTSHKLLTSTIANQLKQHLVEQKVLPSEQFALKEKAWGTAHASIIDQCVAAHCNRTGKTIHAAWLDAAKAFDSVGHSYIRRLLRWVKIPSTVRKVIMTTLGSWEVHFVLHNKNGLSVSEALTIRRGILQGDSLSPLLFCLCVAPVSHMLNQRIPFVTLGNPSAEVMRVNHLAFVDDFKIFTHSAENLFEAINRTKTLFNTIGISLNFGKCAIYHSDNAKETILGIPVLTKDDSYKYLGFKQCGEQKEEATWAGVENRMMVRGKAVWSKNNELSLGQRISAHNTLIIPIIKYYGSMVVGKSDLSLMKSLDQASRFDRDIVKFMVSEKVKCHTVGTERLFLASQTLGYGLQSAKDTLEESLLANWCYLVCREDLSPCLYEMNHVKGRWARSVVRDAGALLKKYGLEKFIAAQGNEIVANSRPIKCPKMASRILRKHVRLARDAKRLEVWGQKGAASQLLRVPNLHVRLSGKWIGRTDIEPEHVRNVIAAQEDRLQWTANMGARGGQCRECDVFANSAHITTVCPLFRETYQIFRHNRGLAELIKPILKQFSLPYVKGRFPRGSYQSNNALVNIDLPIASKFGYVKHDCPDLVVYDHKNKHIFVLEFGIAHLGRLDEAYTEKFGRYAINGDQDYAPGTKYVTGRSVRSLLKQEYPSYKIDVIAFIMGPGGEITKPMWSKYRNAMRSLGVNEKRLERALRSTQQTVARGTSLLIKAWFSYNLM